MCNQELKLRTAGQGIRLWEVAKEMGITDSTLSRKLRTELSEQDKSRFLEALQNISNRKSAITRET